MPPGPHRRVAADHVEPAGGMRTATRHRDQRSAVITIVSNGKPTAAETRKPPPIPAGAGDKGVRM